MKKLVSVLAAVVAAGFIHSSAWGKNMAQDTVYHFKEKTIDGKSVSLGHYKGKVLMIVNVASKCGHTPQYAGLEKLYKKYKDQGFVILGFPCNQFMGQEPGTDSEIKAFCTAKYGVTFPLFNKIEVNGDNTNPLYKFLKKAEPQEDGKTDIGWNFTKFLIDRQGRPLKRFLTTVEPEQTESAIQEALKK